MNHHVSSMPHDIGIYMFFFMLLLLWTRFSLNASYQLAKRVGITMSEDGMTPISTGQEQASLFHASPCPECGRSSGNWRAIVPFVALFSCHAVDCSKKDRKLLLCETVIAAISLLVCLTCYLTRADPLPVFGTYALTIPVIFSDFRYHWIPDRFSFLFLFGGLFASGASLQDRVTGCVGGALVISAMFFMTSLFHRKDVSSSGDVLLMAGAGAWLGILNLFPFIGFITVLSIVSIIVVFLTSPHDEEKPFDGVPLGPAIMGATTLTLAFQPLIIGR